MKCVLFPLMAILLMLLNSCIDGDEEVFIHADGSGRMKVQYRVPSMVMSDKDSAELVELIERKVGREDKLTLITNRVEEKHGQKVIEIEIAATSVIELQELLVENESLTGGGAAPGKSNKMLQSLLGDAQVDVDGGIVGVTRDVNLDSLLSEYLGKRGATLLGDSEFRYTVHLPEAAEQSNAHDILSGGKTLKWTFLLRECQQHPIRMEFKAPIPIPWWIYALLVMVICGLVFVGWLIFKKRSKKSIA